MPVHWCGVLRDERTSDRNGRTADGIASGRQSAIGAAACGDVKVRRTERGKDVDASGLLRSDAACEVAYNIHVVARRCIHSASKQDGKQKCHPTRSHRRLRAEGMLDS